MIDDYGEAAAIPATSHRGSFILDHCDPAGDPNWN